MVPAGLDQMPPGPELASVLAGLGWEGLSEFEQLEVLKAWQRLASWSQGGFYEGVAALHHTISQREDESDAHDFTVGELQAALHLTPRAAGSELVLALELKHRMPKVAEWLRSGVLDLRRVRVLSYGTCHLTDQEVKEVVDRVTDRVAGLTGGQLRVWIRKLCYEINPWEAVARFRSALEERRLVAEPREEGTVNLLGLDLPPARVEAVLGIIERLARRTGREGRSMDQLRADLFLDLLEGKIDPADAGRTGGVELTVDLATLIGLDDQAGELAGLGPVVADVARQVASEQTDLPWRYTVLDPDTDSPAVTGVIRKRTLRPDRQTATARRVPDAAIRRQVLARHRTCVFPGCRMPATECDLDHRIPWSEGGLTILDNLAPLCRRDHRIRPGSYT